MEYGFTTGDEDDEIPWSYSPNKNKKEEYMGDMADMINQDFDWDDDGDYEESVPYGYWKMRDGKLIKISDMTDKHLENAINLFIKRGYDDVVADLIDEQIRRASLARREEMEAHPWFSIFEAGWKAAWRSASDTYCPDVGMSRPQSLESAWKRFKASNHVPKEIKFNLPPPEILNEAFPESKYNKKMSIDKRTEQHRVKKR